MPKPNSDCRATERKHPWPMVRLGDVCEIIAGQSPEGSYYTDESCYTEFHQGSKSFGTRELQISGVYTKKETKIAKPGSLLISVRAPVGDLNITTRRVCIGRGLAALIPDDSISRDFLWLFLTSATKAVNDAAGAGSCFSSLSRSQLSGLEIPLPPLSVQREIVARLERELAAVEKMKKGFEALAETAKAEFKAELKEVFEEISRGGAEMRRLGEVCKNLDSRRVPITKSNREAGKYPYYGASGVVDWVSGYIFDGDYLLVSEDGANLIARSTPIAFSVSGKIWVNNHAHILAFSDLTTQRFVEFYFASIKIDDLVTGAAQPKLTQNALNSIEIPFPPLADQREVVARLDVAKARAEKLEAKAREGVAVCETMRKAILKEAFE